MDIALPYSPDRRYLTGIDWIMGSLDSMTRKATGAGNSSQIILELEGRLEPERLSAALDALAAEIPALFGTPSRDWLNLAPFWQMPPETADRTIARQFHDLPEGSGPKAALDILARAANTPFFRPQDHIGFELVNCGESRSWVGMRFDHWLFDARGSEHFLQYLNHANPDTALPVPFEVTHPSREPNLRDWGRQFRAGRTVNRAIRSLPPSAARLPLPANPNGSVHHYQFEFARMNREETRRFCDDAYATGGFLMKLPYALALAVEGVDRVLARRGQQPAEYVVPVSIDRRSADGDNQPLLFNHLSFVHFYIKREHMESRKALASAIAAQMYEQTKSGFAEEFALAMFPMRIAPVCLLSHLAGRIFAGNFGSFAFSFVGQGGYPDRDFLGHRIHNLLHTPRVSAPPGFGIFANEHADTMNITVAYLDGMLSASEASSITNLFTSSSQ